MRAPDRDTIDAGAGSCYSPSMGEQLKDVARTVIRAVSDFLAEARELVLGWMHGEDLTILIVLGVVALLALFVVVPNRRRY